MEEIDISKEKYRLIQSLRNRLRPETIAKTMNLTVEIIEEILEEK